MGVNETVVDAKMCKFTLESTHIIVTMRPIYTHDGASAKFSTNSHETDYSAVNAGVDITIIYNYLNTPRQRC